MGKCNQLTSLPFMPFKGLKMFIKCMQMFNVFVFLILAASSRGSVIKVIRV